jgi:hypothetical protein
MFVLLLFVCFILCWIGLLMTEQERFCAHCGSKVG